jgi:hypothetical protein
MSATSASDTKEIAETLRAARDRGRPAHLLIGAGCSKSAGIPLAPELIHEINEKYVERCRRAAKGRELNYGGCMKLLTVNERRDLLSPYLEKAKVNWGHLAIAQLMAAGFIERVLTVNFDNFLVRACGLLGIHPAIYDFATAPTDDRSVLVSPSIVHLHGQGYGVKLMNTVEETRAHAQLIAPVVRQSLNEHPLIVIGYSGNADDLFSVFQQGHRDQETLYWLGYENKPPEHVLSFLEGKSYASFIGGSDSDLTLMEIARAVPCWPPMTFIDPAGHLLEMIGQVAEFPSRAASKSTLDLLADLRDRLGAKREELRSSANAEVIASILEGVPESILAQKGADKDEIRSAKKVLTGKESQRNRELSAWAAISRAYDLDELAKSKTDKDARKLWDEAEGLLREAYFLAPKIPTILDNWAALLLEKGYRQKDPAVRKLILEQAREKLTLLLEINPGDTYNLACLEAIEGNLMQCRKNLEVAEAAGKLPDIALMISDQQLDAVKKTDWFKQMISRLK